MRLADLVESIKVRAVVGEITEIEIEHLSIDSRKRGKNTLFICLKGKKTDAHTCIRQVIRNGGVALIVEEKLEVDIPQIVVQDTREVLGILSSEFYGNPSAKLTVVGITGTNGKTTTSYMLAEIWKKAGKKVGIIGTLGVLYGGRRLNSDLTTPDPIMLQETLFNMYTHGVECVVMEVSAHALYYKKVSGVQFSACIFTNFTQDHLDFFEDMQAYKNAKLRLFSSQVCPLAILNGDDEVGREIGEMREKMGGKTLFYGLTTPSDTFAIVTEENLYGSECLFNLEDKLCRVSLKMTGGHNVYNALAAATCALQTGGTALSVSEGLTAVQGVNGRLERIGKTYGVEIFVDFAHTPDGLQQSLSSLKKHCQGRLVCVFGCGGNRDKGKRPIMGETVAKNADFAILTSDNPRYEDPLDIISDIEKGYRRYSSSYVVVPDRRTAIEYALDFASKKDIVLVAGKGGEEYQEIMGIKYPFNDNTVIEKLLQRKGKI